MFKALILDKQDDRTVASIQSIDESRLASSADGGDVLVRVEFSTLNYKDGLAITGKVPVVRTWPMVPGIDFAGVVETSSHPDYQPGDKVVMNGWGAGETHWGGLAQKARVPGDHLIALPANITTRQAMAVGTAGYTAMLCVQALEKHGVGAKDGDVLVTGANGGVGSFAVAILAKRGYRVIASTGRPEEAARLRELGAADIVERATLSEPGKPLQKERWAAAVDCVGSHTLANVCASLRYGGAVAACGLAQGMDLPGDGRAVHPARRRAARRGQRLCAARAAHRGVASDRRRSAGRDHRKRRDRPFRSPTRPRSPRACCAAK